MFEGILNFFKSLKKTENSKSSNSGGTAKERLHLVLMQDRANVSADFLELMKQEIIDVIKKYIEVDESAIDVRLTNKNGDDGDNNAPALYANIPILNIRNDLKKIDPATGKTSEEKNVETAENVEDKQDVSNGEENNIELKQEKDKEDKENNEAKQEENKEETEQEKETENIEKEDEIKQEETDNKQEN